MRRPSQHLRPTSLSVSARVRRFCVSALPLRRCCLSASRASRVLVIDVTSADPQGGRFRNRCRKGGVIPQRTGERTMRCRRGWACLWILVLTACVTPERAGRPVDPGELELADRQCRREALARLGSPETRREVALRDRCDVQSWLCRKSEAWMMREGNPLSSATPRDRAIHQDVEACLKKRGYAR